MRVFYDSDADPSALLDETVAVLGYGIQGRAQALNLRDSGVPIVVGNRDDAYRRVAEQDGFAVMDLAEAACQATLALLLLPDEVQPQLFNEILSPALEPGNGVVFAHGFALRYGLLTVPSGVDVLLLAPRMPGQHLRQRFLAGWGVPAFVSVERDASQRALQRLLALAHALGVTRCGALEVTAAIETELDHFSEHFTFPAIFRTLEIAFEALVEAGYPPEAALMELHGSGEMGQVLLAASREGLYRMIESHASPACQVGISHYWESSTARDPEIRRRIGDVLERIGNGDFARHLIEQRKEGYPELRRWRRERSAELAASEQKLRHLLRGPKGADTD